VTRDGDVFSIVVRDDLLSSTAICCSCKSSVIEMTKNRITTVHVMAMTFCRSLGSLAVSLEARERFAPNSANPSSDTVTQMRLSASSMVNGYGMHSIGQVQQAFQHCTDPEASESGDVRMR
jgi:hypothetical protein